MRVRENDVFKCLLFFLVVMRKKTEFLSVVILLHLDLSVFAYFLTLLSPRICNATITTNAKALASDKFRKFNTGILYSSFPLWALAAAASSPAAQWAGKAAVVACAVAATWGGKVHEDARKARDLANETNGLLNDLGSGSPSSATSGNASMKAAAA
jgi:hypothetical protein